MQLAFMIAALFLQRKLQLRAPEHPSKRQRTRMLRHFSIATTAFSLAILIALSIADNARAESLRCDNKLALQGDTRTEVRAKCGEPADVAHSTLKRRITTARYRGVIFSEDETVVPIEIWTYTLGPHRFMYRLRFVNGVLETLETLGYGF